MTELEEHHQALHNIAGIAWEEYRKARREQKEIEPDDVLARDRLPLLVGGTGQYVWALLEGWCVPAVAPDPHRV